MPIASTGQAASGFRGTEGVEVRAHRHRPHRGTRPRPADRDHRYGQLHRPRRCRRTPPHRADRSRSRPERAARFGCRAPRPRRRRTVESSRSGPLPHPGRVSAHRRRGLAAPQLGYRQRVLRRGAGCLAIVPKPPAIRGGQRARTAPGRDMDRRSVAHTRLDTAERSDSAFTTHPRGSKYLAWDSAFDQLIQRLPKVRRWSAAHRDPGQERAHTQSGGPARRAPSRTVNGRPRRADSHQPRGEGIPRTLVNVSNGTAGGPPCRAVKTRTGAGPAVPRTVSDLHKPRRRLVRRYRRHFRVVIRTGYSGE